MRLKHRVADLEHRISGPGSEKPFPWRAKVPLVDVLEESGWTLGDGPFLANEIVFYEPGPDGPRQIPDPIHDRDRHLLNA
jgi:hypothetical protein